jgi:hypothetical protein
VWAIDYSQSLSNYRDANVNEKALENILVAFGITEKELEVYIFLTKHGVLKGRNR